MARTTSKQYLQCRDPWIFARRNSKLHATRYRVLSPIDAEYKLISQQLLNKPMIPSNGITTRNERWSFPPQRKKKKKTTLRRENDHLRQLLQQDIRGNMISAEAPALLPPRLALRKPTRLSSVHSSMSDISMSSLESMKSVNRFSYSVSAAPTRRSRDSLARYNKTGDTSMSSFGSFSRDKRWMSSLQSPPTAKPKDSCQNNAAFPCRESMAKSTPSRNHKKRRWLSNEESDKGNDQPLQLVARKSSAGYLFPA